MRIMARVGDLVQRTEDSQAQVGYSVVGRSGVRAMLCVVCTVHVKTRSAGFWLSLKTKVGFLGSASKLRSMISLGLASKLVATILVV
jgi:hypothetical protein